MLANTNPDWSVTPMSPHLIPWTRATPITSLELDLSADLALVSLVLKIYSCYRSLIPSATLGSLLDALGY
jgi:hypothetical protein